MAGDLQKQELSYLLSKQAYHSVSDGHLWFSIFSRPPSNQFTRVQRCTCCFVLLFTSMLLNILYYDQVQESKTTSSTSASLVLGPLHISREQVGVPSPEVMGSQCTSSSRSASVRSLNCSRSCQVCCSCKPFVVLELGPPSSNHSHGRYPGGSYL